MNDNGKKTNMNYKELKDKASYIDNKRRSPPYTINNRHSKQLQHSSANRQFTNKTNLFVASSLSLILLARHSSFGDFVDPLSSAFLPKWSALVGVFIGAVVIKCCLISLLGYKASLIISVAGFILSLLFHFSSDVAPLAISGFVEGICCLLLTVTLASYVTHLAFEHSDESKLSRHHATSKYLALPYFFYKLAVLMIQIFYKTLHRKQEEEDYYFNNSTLLATNNLTSPSSSSFINDNCKLQLFFPQSTTASTNITTDFEMHFKLSSDQSSMNNVIIGASGGACSMAIAGIYHFLENKQSVYHAESRTRSVKYNLFSSLYLFKDKSLLLMLPLILYMGMAKAYIYSKGVNYTIYCDDTSLMYLFLTYTAVCCLSSITYHVVGERVNSLIVVLVSLFVHFSLLLLDLLRIERPIFVQFIVATILGLTEVILYCHVKGAFGVLYESKQEACYTIFEVFQKVGFYAFHVALATVSNSNGCNIGLVVFLVLSSVCYAYSTLIVRRKGTLHKFQIPYFM